MSRFLFYLILINMLTNMVSITPRVLISGSTNGTVLSLILALPIGMAFTYIIISLFSHFPGQDLPEILKSYTPKWISTPILLFLSVLVFCGAHNTYHLYIYYFTFSDA